MISSGRSNEKSSASAERPQVQVNVIHRQIAHINIFDWRCGCSDENFSAAQRLRKGCPPGLSISMRAEKVNVK